MFFIKKMYLPLGLILASNMAFAQASPNLANEFALEAGKIGGVAQACGQNISVYNSRVSEAVNVMTDSAGSQQALSTYTKALMEAAEIQTKNHAISCSTAIQSFNSLPIMQSDYKTNVLPSLAKMANPAAPTPTTPSQTPEKPTANAPQLLPLQFAQTPPTQQMVTGNNNAS